MGRANFGGGGGGGGGGASLAWKGDWAGVVGYPDIIYDFASGVAPGAPWSYFPSTAPVHDATAYVATPSGGTAPTPQNVSLTSTVDCTFVGFRGVWEGSADPTATLDGVAMTRRIRQNSATVNQAAVSMFTSAPVPAGAHTGAFTDTSSYGVSWASLTSLQSVNQATGVYASGAGSTRSFTLPAAATDGIIVWYSQINGSALPAIVNAGGLTWTLRGASTSGNANSMAVWTAPYSSAQAGTTVTIASTADDLYGVSAVAMFPGEGGNPPSVVADSATAGLTNALQLPSIADNQTAAASLSVTMPDVGGSVEFYRKISSAAGDVGRFLIDGVIQYSESGEQAWAKRTYQLSAGAHTLRWEYVKDASGVAGLDAHRIAGIKVAATPTTVYAVDDLVRYRGETWKAVRVNSNVVPAEGPDWTIFAARGKNSDTGTSKGAYSPSATYNIGDIVQHAGLDYVALKDEIVGTAPEAHVTYPLKGGVTAPFENATLGQTHYAMEFTPNQTISFDAIDVLIANAITPASAVHLAGFASAINTTTGDVTWIKNVSTNAEIPAHSAWRYPLQMTLQAGVKVFFVIIVTGGAHAIGHRVAHNGRAGVNGTIGEVRYGNSNFGTLGSANGTVIPFALVSPKTPVWRVVGTGPTKLNAAGTAVVPVDNSDSWIVGSDSFDQKAGADATPTSQRAFFNKGNGAFRAGYVTDTRWNVSQQGTNSAAFGALTTASGQETSAWGYASEAIGARSTAGGYISRATGDMATAIGREVQAPGYASISQGAMGIAGRSAQRTLSSNSFTGSPTGDQQLSDLVLAAETTDATSKLLTTNTFGGPITLSGQYVNVLTIAGIRSYKLKIDVVARRSDAGNTNAAAGWTFEGVLTRDSAGTRFLAGGLAVQTWADTAAAAWDVTPSINTSDTTNHYLALTVTGEAAKTIRWVANINWVEVG